MTEMSLDSIIIVSLDSGVRVRARPRRYSPMQPQTVRDILAILTGFVKLDYVCLGIGSQLFDPK